MLPFQLLIAALGGWLQREQADVIAFLREENRTLKAQLSGRRLQRDDAQRRRLAVLGQRHSQHSDAVSGTQLQRVRGAVRAFD